MNPENLTDEDRDKLLLNMAGAMNDLARAMQDLSEGINLLLSIVTRPCEVGSA